MRLSLFLWWGEETDGEDCGRLDWEGDLSSAAGEAGTGGDAASFLRVVWLPDGPPRLARKLK